MAVDYFLKLDGIEGESRDATHAGEIDIQSFSFAESNFGAPAGSAAGKASLQAVHFTMSVNKATPKLMLSCASGTHIKDATLTCRKAGTTPLEFLKIVLTDVIVSSFQIGGDGSTLPQDSFSLEFAKIEIDYTPQSPDGSAGTVVQGGWDLKANRQA